MNILYLCDEYPPGHHGGIGTAVQLLARALVVQGHQVVVAGCYPWGYGGDEVFNDHGVVVYRFRRGLDSRLLSGEAHSLRTRGMLWWMKRARILEWDIRRSLDAYGTFLQGLIEKHAIDLVEQADYQDYMRFCASYVTFPVLPVLTVLKMHSSMTFLAHETGRPVRSIIRQMEADLLRRADAVASVSRYTADRTASYLDYPHPISVLYNGIELRPSAPVEKSDLHVVYAGSLRVQKGVGQLLLAWNKVNQRLPAARLSIYGKGRVETFAPSLSREARGSVRFMGHVDHATLRPAFARANLAVFPSFAESFALAPLEAMSVGTAVLYTSRTSGPELITHDETGCLVDPADVDGLAMQIQRLLMDKALCRRLAKAGREHVTARFGIERIARDHVTWYGEAQGRWAGRSR